MYRNKDNHEFLFADKEPVIDSGVWNKWRAFRIPGQCGLDKDCPLTPVDGSEFVLTNYLINKSEATVDFHDYDPAHKLSKNILKQFSKAPVHVPSKDKIKIEKHMFEPPPVSEITEEGQKDVLTALQVEYADHPAIVPLSVIPASSGYQAWRNVGYVLKGMDVPFGLFNTWSATSTAGNYKGMHDCFHHWRTLSKGKTTIGSLKWLANQCNRKLYSTLSHTAECESFPVDGVPFPETVCDGRYLEPITSMVKKVFVSAGLGCGKTRRIKEFITARPKASFAVISPRISYSHSTLGDLHTLGFTSYQDSEGDIRCNRIIISVESLHRLIHNYDYVILDEIETILMSITSSPNEKEFDRNVSRWDSLLAHANQLLITDAFLTKRTIDYFAPIPGDSHLMTHIYESPRKTMIRYEDPRDFNSKFEELLRAGKRIYGVINSKKQMLEVYAPILRRLGIRHILYHQNVGDKVKRTLQNVEKHWQDVQVVLTTPTITIGINQSEVYFDHRFIYTCSHSCVCRDTYQAMWRVRQTTTDTDYWFSDGRKNVPGTKGEPLTHAGLTEFLDKKRWGTLPAQTISNEHIRSLAIWNRLEENLSNVSFQKWFQQIIEDKLNYRVQVVVSTHDKPITVVKLDSTHYDDIPLLTSDEAAQIKAAQQFGSEEEITQETILALRKHVFIENLDGFDPVDADKLWRHCSTGYNMKPLDYIRWNIEGIPDSFRGDQIDIFYRDTTNQFIEYRKIEALLPAVGEVLTEEHLKTISEHLTIHKDTLHTHARIVIKGDEKIIKTINAILKRFSLLHVASKQVQIKGKKTRVYTIASKFSDTIEHITASTRTPFNATEALFSQITFVE